MFSSSPEKRFSFTSTTKRFKLKDNNSSHNDNCAPVILKQTVSSSTDKFDHVFEDVISDNKKITKNRSKSVSISKSGRFKQKERQRLTLFDNPKLKVLLEEIENCNSENDDEDDHHQVVDESQIVSIYSSGYVCSKM